MNTSIKVLGREENSLFLSIRTGEGLLSATVQYTESELEPHGQYMGGTLKITDEEPQVCESTDLDTESFESESVIEEVAKLSAIYFLNGFDRVEGMLYPLEIDYEWIKDTMNFNVYLC